MIESHTNWKDFRLSVSINKNANTNNIYVIENVMDE